MVIVRKHGNLSDLCLPSHMTAVRHSHPACFCFSSACLPAPFTDLFAFDDCSPVAKTVLFLIPHTHSGKDNCTVVKITQVYSFRAFTSSDNSVGMIVELAMRGLKILSTDITAPYLLNVNYTERQSMTDMRRPYLVFRHFFSMKLQVSHNYTWMLTLFISQAVDW